MEKREKFISWCDKAMAFSFYALIYFLPISIALSETFTVLALICFFLKRGAVFCGRLKEVSSSGSKLSFGGKITCFLKSFKPVSSPLSWPIVFVLLLSFLSILLSQYRLVSLNGFLGKVLQSAFLYFNFIECMNSRKRIRIFINVFFVSCTLICINGIFQAVTGHGFIHGHAFEGRILSSLRSANDLAAYLVVVLPVLFSIVFLTNPRKQNEGGKMVGSVYSISNGTKAVCLIFFLLGFVCFGFTYSRGAWVGFVLSLLMMSLFGLRSRKIITYSGLLIICFLFVFYPGTPFEKVFSKGAYFFSETVTPSETSSPPMSEEQKGHEEYFRRSVGDRFHMNNITIFLVQNNRVKYWQRSLKIIKDYPAFGCGLNTYALVEGRYDVGWGGYPHNSYLQMMAEVGFIGLAIFLWMLFVLFRDSLRALRRIKTQELKMLMFGFLTGLLGFLIHSFFDTNFYSVQLGSLFWIIMGVIVALQKIEKV